MWGNSSGAEVVLGSFQSSSTSVSIMVRQCMLANGQYIAVLLKLCSDVLIGNQLWVEAWRAFKTTEGRRSPGAKVRPLE